MSNIFIDPAILTTPPEHTSKEDVQAWFDLLLCWLQEVSSSHSTWYHLLDATYALILHNRFPDPNKLRNLAKKHRLNVDIEEITRGIAAFFTNPKFDLIDPLTRFGYVVEAEEDSVLIQPEELVARWIEPIQNEVSEAFVSLCLCKQKLVPFALNLFIATCRFANELREAQISFVLKYILPEYPPDHGQRMTQTFPLLYTPEDLIAAVDIITVWNRGEDAIRSMIKQEVQRFWSSTTPMDFSFGGHFFSSVADASLFNDAEILAKIIRIAAAILVDQAQNINCNLRPKRTQEAGNSPQETRIVDGAKAWRLTLTDKGAGWRLQYWRIPTTPKNTIEFMIVCKKNDHVKTY